MSVYIEPGKLIQVQLHGEMVLLFTFLTQGSDFRVHLADIWLDECLQLPIQQGNTIDVGMQQKAIKQPTPCQGTALVPFVCPRNHPEG